MRTLKTIKRPNPEDINKIQNLDLDTYWDDYMKRRPANDSGYINMSKENFRSMVRKAETEDNMKKLIEIYVNFVGHRNILP